MKKNYSIEIKSILLQKLPVSPYFASVFITLMSIVGGTVFGYLFNIININNIINNFNFLNILIIINIIFTTIVIWHHVIVHNQFVAWKISLSDSFVPFFSGIFLLSLINTMNDRILPYIIFTLIIIGSFIAYLIGYVKLKKNYKVILKIYQNLFGFSFAKDLFQAILKYDRKIIKIFGYFSIYFIGITIAIFYFNNFEIKLFY